MTKNGLAVLCSVLILTGALSGCLDDFNGGSYYSFPESIDIEFTKTIDISVNQGEINYTVCMMLPQSIGGGSDAMQELQSWSATPGYQTVDYHGSQRLEWTGDATTGQDFQMTASVRSRTYKWTLTSFESSTPDMIPSGIKETYPSDEDQWKIRPTDPMIREIADNLEVEGGTVKENLKAVFDYIETRITYNNSRDGQPKDCVQTLTDGKGDCDDQSILFCSLSRAMGIPAWLEFGYLYDESDGSFIGHAWIQTYLPLSPSEGGTVNIDMANGEFLYRTAYHITDWVDVGDATIMEDYYNSTKYSGIPPLDVAVSSSQHVGHYAPSAEEVRIELDGGGPVPLPRSFVFLTLLMGVALAAYVCNARQKR